MNDLNNKDSKEILSSDSQPLLFDSGNPFMSTQTILFRRGKFEFSPLKERSSQHQVAYTDVDSFFDNQIHFALVGVNRFSKNPHILNNAGIAYLNSCNYGIAEEYFVKALDINNSFYPALANLAKLYFLQGKYDEAIKIYDTIIRHYPNDIRTQNNYAHALLNKGETDNALKLLSSIAKNNDNDASVFNNIGVIYLLKGDVNKAISNLRKALEINSNFANAFNNLGSCFVLQKDYVKAIKHFLAAISLNKNFLQAIKNLARTYQEINEHKKVSELIKQCLVYNNPDSELYDILADTLYLTSNYQQAIKYLKQSLTMMPFLNNPIEQSRVHNNMAVAYSKLEKITEAVSHYIESLALHKEPATYNNFFNSLTKSNKLSEAKKILIEARQLFPDNTELLVSEGKYYYRIKDYPTACKFLRQAIEIKPELLSPYLLLNHIVAEIDKDLATAIQIARDGLKLNPTDHQLINNLSYTLLQTNDKNNIAEARRLLEKVKNIENVYLFATKGLLFIKEDNLQEGERLYNRAANLAESTELKNKVKQKKLLELGRYYLAKDEKKKAKSCLLKALKIKIKDDIYQDQIKELLSSLGNNP